MNNLIKLDKNKIINLVNIHNVMLTVKQLLLLIGYEFNNLYIDKFWNNIEDDIWIYIDNEMLKWIGYNSSDLYENKKYYIRLLSNNFNKEIDFKQINNYDFIKFHSGLSHLMENSQETYKKIGNVTKYLIVSPDCFKQSLMLVRTEKAKEIRQYYTELEKIFKFYILYQNKYQELKAAHELEQSQKQIENHKLQLQEAENILNLSELQLEEEKERNILLHNRIVNKSLLEYLEYIYIITTKRYASESIFKIGYTNNLYNRLCSYNTGKINEDKYYYCYYYKCHDAKALESIIFSLLKNFKIKNEMYQINFEDLCKILNFVCKNDTKNVNMVNNFIKNDYSNSLSKEINIPNEIVIKKNEVLENQEIVEEEIPEVVEELIIPNSILFIKELAENTFNHKDFDVKLNKFVYQSNSLYNIYLDYCKLRKIHNTTHKLFMRELKLINLKTSKIVYNKKRIWAYRFTIQELKTNFKTYLNNPDAFHKDSENITKEDLIKITHINDFIEYLLNDNQQNIKYTQYGDYTYKAGELYTSYSNWHKENNIYQKYLNNSEFKYLIEKNNFVAKRANKLRYYNYIK